MNTLTPLLFAAKLNSRGIELDETVIIGAILILLGIEFIKLLIFEVIIENAVKNGIKKAITDLKNQHII